MWTMTTRGMYSVVQDRNNPKQLAVRSRCEDDIYNLKGLVPDEAISNMLVDEQADYRYRIFVTHKQWAFAVGQMAKEINYSNFKDKIGKIDPDRAVIYARVWTVLLQIDRYWAALPAYGDNEVITTIFGSELENEEDSVDTHKAM